MARDFGASGDRLQRSGGVVSSPAPHTVAAWIRPDTLGFYDITGVYQSDNTKGYRLTLDNGPIRYTSNMSAFRYADSASSCSAGEWCHAAGKAIATDSRYAYLNGVPGTQGTGTASDYTEANTAVGAQPGNGARFDGRIAEVAWWDVALDDDEIKALAYGMSPMHIRPGSLQAYWPIIGESDEPCWCTDPKPMTVNGTPGLVAHAPVSVWIPGIDWEEAAVAAPAAEAFFENRHPIEHGMKPQTASGIPGVLIE